MVGIGVLGIILCFFGIVWGMFIHNFLWAACIGLLLMSISVIFLNEN